MGRTCRERDSERGGGRGSPREDGPPAGGDSHPEETHSMTDREEDQDAIRNPEVSREKTDRRNRKGSGPETQTEERD